ncbi:MAG: hypothetical protein ABIP45_07820, partial [Knoellia sp.]
MRLLRHLGAGLVLGALTGLAARGFMALFARDPEFTWGGTSLIVALFTVAGLSFSAAYDVKLRHRPRGWKLLALPSIVVGLGLGILLLPGYLGMSLALSRRRVVRAIGLILLVGYAGLVPSLLDTPHEPVSLRMVIGIAVLLGCCAAVAAGGRV